MSASETVRRHTFGAPEDMGPPALERAAHQLMIQEANRRLGAEKSVEQLTAELAKAKSDAQVSESARVAAETKVGELTAELAKRQAGYQTAIADMDTKLLQAREGRATAEMLAAQARAEADAERRNSTEVVARMGSLETQIAALMVSDRTEITPPAPVTPPSYRVNVVGRDAAGDLRTLEIVPVERT